MCGFLAEFCFHNNEPTLEANFFELLNLSKHRGPDATLTFRNNNYQLGFNRLAILDLSEAGNQPKRSPSERYHLVFNGEIYNYKELAQKYGLKNLMSSSDTEVICHLLDKIGITQTIQELNGMFAITVVDHQENLCILARDFAGIKPLFYGLSKNGVVSASQFDQVFKHQWHNKSLTLRPEIIKEYFGIGYMQAPNTIYDNMFQVEPGSLLIIDNFGNVKTQVFCQFNKNQKTESELDSNLKEILTKTIKRQLVSDVSIATFLSGGIDSPLISAYAKKEKHDIEAFTVKVNDKDLNESEIAKTYAKHLDIKQHIHTIEGDDLIESIEEHFLAFSEPFGDFSSIPTFAICKASKERHTVMLSGDGGDELFFGYPRMLDVLNKSSWFKLPLGLRKPLVRITNKLKITNTWAPFFQDLDEFIMFKHIQIPKKELDDMFSSYTFSEELKNLYQFTNHSKTELLKQMRWNEFYAHMQRVLVKVDRASMWNSLEVRVPFLDKDVIQKAWSMQQPMLKDKADLKLTLKQLLSQEIPEELLNKKKMGFTVPIYNWLHNELKVDVLYHTLERPFYGEEVIHTEHVKTFVIDFFAHKHSHSWGIWHVYAWQKWANAHVEDFN